MEFVSLSLAQQALINLLCLCIGEDKEHALRVLKSALYIAEREGGEIDLIIAATLLYGTNMYFASNVLLGIEYSAESAQKVQQMLSSIESGESTEQCIVHDAILLNIGQTLSLKQMQTSTGKALVKERKSVMRLFTTEKDAQVV